MYLAAYTHSFDALIMISSPGEDWDWSYCQLVGFPPTLIGTQSLDSMGGLRRGGLRGVNKARQDEGRTTGELRLKVTLMSHCR